MNGKRNVSTSFDNIGSGYLDVDGLIPNIALERVEIVKDGSSALYGSDAIAGVVNFITRRNFEGFELQYDYAEDSETGRQQDNLISAIMGVSGDRGNITISASYLDRFLPCRLVIVTMTMDDQVYPRLVSQVATLC